MTPLETYLSELRTIRSSGAAVEETSYYGPLANLLNEIGKDLKPRVRCIINLRNQGAGIPDGGLFTADQFPKATAAEPLEGQIPARGAIEVKGTGDDAWLTADGEQVSKYWRRYRQVLVTNYRDFVLVGQDADGKPVILETYRLAASEREFWSATAHPHAMAAEHNERFTEYLKRVLLSTAALAAPQDVAWFLASYARDAKSRVEHHKDLSALAAVREALEQALGMKFTDERGEHFFRSTLVQTIFYGVFSAWVLWHREKPGRKDAFNWHEAGWLLRVPFIRTLYHQIASADRLGPLGLEEVLDWTAAALNRVDRAVFFERFQDEHAVQYFYEPFLEAFDPELRKELGVWYTPQEIVQYQVARVDTVLREELGVADGLADPNVVVLDPCCGTAAYLVEVLRHIAGTLRAKGGDALVAADLKKAAMTRVFGFELLPAPFVVSHLQLGLMLHDLGAPLSDKKHERVGVYLTNSLTGWEPPKEPKQRVMDFVQELQAEKDAAGHIKRDAKVLVVLGNPPYNAFAGVSPEEEEGLVEPYKKGLNVSVAAGGWGIKKFNLDDLYVRFFRLAERRIAEMTGRGVVSFISNFSYLTDQSFVVMRQRFLREFDKLWFDCMNGDSRETGKLTPEGKPDPSVFSTEYNREGIRVGTAVCVLVRTATHAKQGSVRFRDFWGVDKRQELLASLARKRFDAAYRRAKPSPDNRFSFQPEHVSAEYKAWAKVAALSRMEPCNGLMEKRGGALIAIDREVLEERMRDYFDADLPWEEYAIRHTSLTEKQARFHPKQARAKAIANESYDPARVLRYAIRPFDVRWCYYTGVRPVWNEPRPTLKQQCFSTNVFFMTRPAGVASPEGTPFCFTRLLGDNDFQRGHAYYFPILLAPTKPNGKNKPGNGQNSFLTESPAPNLSAAALRYLAALRIKDPDGDAERAGLLWMHALAIGYSPEYLAENADGIRRDWPRIPLPDKRKTLEESAALGRQVAALLDTESEASGVTAGNLDALMRRIGAPAKLGGGMLDPERDFAVTAGWGHAGKAGVTMPAKGRIEKRPYDPDELEAIAAAAAARGLATEQALALLGRDTCDVYLNDAAFWRNVPTNVWEYFIGGYQVIKKWLSYRELELLGRALKTDEVREVTNIARRIAAIILLQPALDANYRAVKAAAYTWPAAEG